MTFIIFATDQPTAWSWVAFAGLAVALSLGGAAVIRLNRRQRQVLDDQRASVHAVPAQLRFRPAPLWLRVAVPAAALGAATAASIAIGTGAGIAAMCLVFAPFYFRVQRQHRRHRQQVIDTVHAQASSMDHAALTSLVEGLEATHGRAEMRPLRDLLKTRTSSQT